MTSALSPWIGRLALGDPRRRFVTRLGDVDVQQVAGQTSNAVSARPSARFDLPCRDRRPVDFFAPLTIQAVETVDGAVIERRLFTGLVDAAIVDGDVLRVTGLGAHELAEKSLGRLTTNVTVPELVHMLARTAGFTEDRLKIQGIEKLPHELVQVIVPIDGIEANVDMSGAVRFTTDARIAATFASFGEHEAPVYAVTYVEAARLYDAEQSGVEAIQAFLDRLLAATAYGLSTRPGGAPLTFSRAAARARPTARSIVHVMGIKTGRHWCRDRAGQSTAASVDLVRLLREWPELLRPGSSSVANALVELRRAADSEVGHVERVQALWNAIEFYATDVELPKLFDKPVRRQLTRAVAAMSLTTKQQKRVTDLLNQGLNNPPLFVRLKERARQDGVPLTPRELNLLAAMRMRRNDAAHGRGSGQLDIEHFEWAVSVAARLLLFRHVSEVS